MSLDVYLTKTIPTTVYDANLTHNLSGMAIEAGIYECLWRPSEYCFTHAGDLIAPLTKAIRLMQEDPARFDRLNAPNGWGTREQFLPWLCELLYKCQEHPNAEISVSV